MTPTRGKFKRAIEIGKMAAKMGIKELTSGNAQSRVDQAKILTETLFKLKGAAMKAGQLLSLDLDDYFPPEAIQIISQLQSHIVDQPDLAAPEILKRELGEEKFLQVKDLQSKALAAASIGQVFRAQLGSDEVVFKIQYPDIENTIDSDVDLLRKAVSTLAQLYGREFSFKELFSEIKTVLRTELNYTLEADSLEKFSGLYQSHQWRSIPLRTPKLVREYSTQKVLCLSYESAPTLKKWMDSPHTPAERERVGTALLELFIMEFFVWGVVQTDPNPSNFLIQYPSNPEIVVLDFGATKSYDPEFRKAYKKMSMAVFHGDPAEILRSAIEFGILDPRESSETQKAFIDLLEIGIRPFRPTKENPQALFDFGDESFLKDNQQRSKDLVRSLQFTSPPHQLLFLHRKLGGVYAVLRKLKLEIELLPFWEIIVRS